MLSKLKPLSTSTFKEMFDAELDFFLRSKIKPFQKSLGVSRINTLLDYIYTLSSSGKRYRPFLLYSSYVYYGGKKDITNFLFGIELLHIFALVHDDIMDKSESRHGVGTAQIEYKKYYDIDKDHVAKSQAILLGDLIFSLAEECFFQGDSKIPSTLKIKAQTEYRILVNEVIYGQMVDVDMSNRLSTSKKDIYKKMVLKSGRYSVMRPLLIGATLAGAKKYDTDFINVFGENVGVAFQIQDDIFDCSNDQRSFGKKAFGDIKTAQQTYISYYMQSIATPLQSKKFVSYYGRIKNYTKTEMVEISGLLSDSGAMAFTRQEAKKHFILAQKSINSYDKKDKTLWLEILETIRGRKK